jgi:hypothetical protein
MKPLPQQIRAIMPDLELHLRKKLVRGTLECFGADSIIGKLEVERLEQREAYLLHLNAACFLASLRSPIDVFKEGMNTLLRWAGVGERSYKEIMAF